MDKIEIFQFAIKLLDNPLPINYNNHGNYCPYCALLLAINTMGIPMNSGYGNNILSECCGMLTQTGIRKIYFDNNDKQIKDFDKIDVINWLIKGIKEE